MGKRTTAGRMFASLTTDAEQLRKLSATVSLALDGAERRDGLRAPDPESEGLGRMFAALSATNEAVMRAKTRAELFELVCDAAARGGRFASAVIALAEPGADRLRVVATAGPTAERLWSLEIAVSEDRPEGRGVAGTAFRTGRPMIRNDALADQRGTAFQERARVSGFRSSAALPLLRGDESIGILLFLSNETETFTPPLVALLERLAESVAFAIENFDRLDLRRLAEQHEERLSRMFAALSATNAAILRARSADDMFRAVCDAATGPGKMIGASVCLRIPALSRFEQVACSGRLKDVFGATGIAAAPDEACQNVFMSVFRSGEACFIREIDSDPRIAPWRAALTAEGASGLAVLPLRRGGTLVGIAALVVDQASGPLDDERMRLTARIAENISFGMEMVERQDQKDRATRMFAALSATNEAIMRARTRPELFDLVCEAAAKGGDFTATLIGLAEPGSDYFRIAGRAARPRRPPRMRGSP